MTTLVTPEEASQRLQRLVNKYPGERSEPPQNYLRGLRQLLAQQRYSSYMCGWTMQGSHRDNGQPDGKFLEDAAAFMRCIAIEQRHKGQSCWALRSNLTPQHLEQCLGVLTFLSGGVNHGDVVETTEKWPAKPTPYDTFNVSVFFMVIALILLLAFAIPAPPASRSGSSRHSVEL